MVLRRPDLDGTGASRPLTTTHAGQVFDARTHLDDMAIARFS